MLIGPSRVRAAPPDPRPRAARHGGSPTCPHRGPRATRGILGRRNTMRSRGLRDLNPGPAPNPALHRIRGLVTTRSWVYSPGRRNGMCRKGLRARIGHPAGGLPTVGREADRRDGSAGRLRRRGPRLILPFLLPAATSTSGLGERHHPGHPGSAMAGPGPSPVPHGSGSGRMRVRPVPNPASGRGTGPRPAPGRRTDRPAEAGTGGMGTEGRAFGSGGCSGDAGHPETTRGRRGRS